jgi:hypothetical protein
MRPSIWTFLRWESGPAPQTEYEEPYSDPEKAPADLTPLKPTGLRKTRAGSVQDGAGVISAIMPHVWDRTLILIGLVSTISGKAYQEPLR